MYKTLPPLYLFDLDQVVKLTAHTGRPHLHLSAQDLSSFNLIKVACLTSGRLRPRVLWSKQSFVLWHAYWKYKSLLISHSDGYDVNYFFKSLRIISSNLWESFLSTWKPNHMESWKSIGGAETLGWISFDFLSDLEKSTSSIKRLVFWILMTWLENAILCSTWDVTGWEQHLQDAISLRNIWTTLNFYL